MSSLDSFIGRTHIAYFSMEMAIRPEIHSYAGGLGILAGDTARSCADLELPVVFVTLISRAGYFRQTIDADGRQVEEPDWWHPSDWCTPLDAMVAVPIGGRPVWIRPWLYVHTCPHGHRIPILLLDTDLDQNAADDREITHHLYGGDETYRLKQEIVLGIGGIRLLRALGFDLHTYHLNEGHAALLTLELMNRWRIPPEERIEGEPPYDVAEVRERCVFTTHTPVEAGHDRFSYALFDRLMPGVVELDSLRHLAGADALNMTRLAFNLSGYVNGVARRHAQTTGHMFPGYRIHAVTNGVHVGTWTHDAFARLYQANFPEWRHEPEILVRALQLPEDEVWRCHLAAKGELIDRIRESAGVTLDAGKPPSRRRWQGRNPPDPRDFKRARRQGYLRFPSRLRHGSRQDTGRGLRYLAEHPAAAAGGLGHQRHEGGAQRSPQPQRARRLVDRGMCRRCERLGYRVRWRRRGGS
jgi:starch phosphorylase